MDENDCPECHGGGIVLLYGNRAKCPVCRGTGKTAPRGTIAEQMQELSRRPKDYERQQMLEDAIEPGREYTLPELMDVSGLHEIPLRRILSLFGTRWSKRIANHAHGKTGYYALKPHLTPLTSLPKKSPGRQPGRSVDRLVEWFKDRSNRPAKIEDIKDGVKMAKQTLLNALADQSFERVRLRQHGHPDIYQLTEAVCRQYGLHYSPLPVEADPHPATPAKPKAPQGPHVGMNTVQFSLTERQQHADGLDESKAVALATQLAIELVTGNVEGAHSLLDKYWDDKCKSMKPLTAKDIIELPVASLGLELRTVNALDDIGVLNLEQLLQKKPPELLAIPNVGEGQVRRIIEVARLWVNNYQQAVAREAIEARRSA